MFDSLEEASVQRECRPDPEQMLQAQRVYKEKVEAALSAFRLVYASNLHINGSRDNENETSQLIGRLTLELWQVELSIQQWLKELDK